MFLKFILTITVALLVLVEAKNSTSVSNATVKSVTTADRLVPTGWSTPISTSNIDTFSSSKKSLIKTSATSVRRRTGSKVRIRFNRYHHYDEMVELMKMMANDHPNVARLYSIGKSVQGRELWVMHLTNHSNNDNNDDDVSRLKPNVKYVANMHGNEAAGREMLLHLMAYLINFSNKSINVRNLLNNTNIHLMPSMNPDGFEISKEGKCEGPGRFNANRIDLNRNFPDRIFNSTEPEQPETQAIRKWIDEKQFVLSANIHGGALVVNYPFDASAEEDSVHLERTPDHDVFIHLAMAYAKRHPKLRSRHGQVCRANDKNFENGITNGNAWYPIQGSMQDYNYIFAGTMEVTLEISCCKYPNATNLLSIWNENKLSLLALLNEANRGIRGKIRDYYTEKPIPRAELMVLGRSVIFRSDHQGKFWRILLPGDYVLMVQAPGYRRLQKQFTVTKNKITVMEIFLKPIRKPVYNDKRNNHQNQPSVIYSYPIISPSYEPLVWIGASNNAAGYSRSRSRNYGPLLSSLLGIGSVLF